MDLKPIMFMFQNATVGGNPFSVKFNMSFIYLNKTVGVGNIKCEPSRFSESITQLIFSRLAPSEAFNSTLVMQIYFLGRWVYIL